MAVVNVRRIRRGDVFLVDLDPTRGTEIQKTRPCVVVSPDELNGHLRTIIIAPLPPRAVSTSPLTPPLDPLARALQALNGPARARPIATQC